MKVNVASSISPSFDGVFFDIQEHKYTHYWLAGGRGSTKSSFIGLTIPLLLMQCPNCHAVVLRKVRNTVKNSVFPQIQMNCYIAMKFRRGHGDWGSCF